MPYTPPSHRSPASSVPSSPNVSRRSSFHGTSPSAGSTSAGSAPRPALPRSASYLTKHRRTLAAATESAPSANGSTSDITPPRTLDDPERIAANHNALPIRQSPPPVADTRSMPPGAIISPPESQSSSEDEGVTVETRGRQIENMKELHDAISAMRQHRESSPNGRKAPGDMLVHPSQIGEMVDAAVAGKRRISHSRSSTEPSIFLSKSADASLTASEDSEQDDPPKKPQMVRKKSGELVRPALRPASQRRPSSMPGTPTFSKAVHFDSHLEHVRHFLQVDRPLAVSTGSSPVDNYDSDAEYPFHVEDKSIARSPPFEWEIVITNFPAETPIRSALPARLERVWMSNDQKCLIGSIAVTNLAFQKYLVCRFTFDYWKTTSEVVAEYCHEIRQRETDVGHDRFQFTIKLSDLANLESKTLYFCVRYNVNGFEYWDNNNNMNFQVDFKKKMLPQNGKKNFQGASSRTANSLPRSNRRTNTSTGPRPKSMPVGFLDEFGRDSKFPNFDQTSIHDYLGESGPIRLKSSKSTTSLPSDNLPNRLSIPSGIAFANRYDLNAAISAHKGSIGSPKADGLYMKANNKTSLSPSLQTSPSNSSSKAPGPVSGPASTVASKIPGTDSPASATIASSSYEEIVNKYCFFNGSKQSTPHIKDETLQSGRYDGVGDDFFTRTSSSLNTSSNVSPIMVDTTRDGALRYAIHQNLNPYFQNTHIAIGASPAESPLNGPPALSRSSLSPPSSTTPTVKSASPTPMNGGFSPLPGTSTRGFGIDSPAFNHAQHHSDRFPFAADAHTSTAIRG